MLVKLAFAALLIYFAGCAALFIFQRSLIYFPQPRSYRHGITVMTLEAGGEHLLVSTRPQDVPGALIYFGGNAEDVSFNMPDLTAAFSNRAIYLMHYRGYGGSSGRPSEDGLVTDAIALFDRVHSLHPNVVLMGRSLGSGVAVHLASLRPVERLILVTPFDSLQDVAASLYPYVPVRRFLRDKFESWRYAPKVTAPTTIIAAERDEVIPPDNTRLLKTRFQPGIASFVVVPGAGHNNISGTAQYLLLLKNLGEIS